MATVLYAAITNVFSRNALSKKLIDIVKATQDTAKAATVPASNFLTLKVSDVEKLTKADPTLIQVGPVSADGKTQAVQASAAGIAAVADAAPLVEQPKPVHTATTFALEDAAPLPPIKRGGDRSGMYPFDALTISPAPGSSFFVPVSETMPNPGKTMAATVSSATRKYKTSTPPRVFTIRADVDEFWTGHASNPDGKTPGRKGARIYRVEPPAPAAPAAPAAPVAPVAPVAGATA